jgi:hypothetical protein
LRKSIALAIEQRTHPKMMHIVIASLLGVDVCIRKKMINPHREIRQQFDCQVMTLTLSDMVRGYTYKGYTTYLFTGKATYMSERILFR